MQDTALTYEEWKEIKKPNLSGKLHLLIDNLNNVENAGLILRSASALGVSEILFHRPAFSMDSLKLKRYSRSANERMHIHQFDDMESLRLHFRNNPYATVTALEYTHTSRSIYKWQPDSPLLLAIGNEQKGISPEVIELVDEAVHIPLLGQQSSINVACACSIALGYVNQLWLTD